MQHKIIKLSLLVVMMTVLTSSKESICVNKPKDSLKTKDTSLKIKKENGGKGPKELAAEKENSTDDAAEPTADYKMPVIPFSRFIL